jgi:hypothetical protein
LLRALLYYDASICATYKYASKKQHATCLSAQ